ncbi:MAG: acyl-[Alphaproteobacteria bacterium]|nr:acyl-[ACP]--phospholipid O-acyltransferase [Alphaproteobacteria bacterium]
MNLLRTERFLPLLITQFLGAFNDNLFKNALLTLVALKMSAQSDILSNIIAGLFILPFFLFSATAGELADKYSRHKIARLLKIAELILMLCVGIAWHFQSINLLIAVLALMGTQSAFFGPVKYSLLPQQLKPEELVSGNAYIESTTYSAILCGLILGTLLPIETTVFLLIGLAALGVISSFFIPEAKAPRPKLKMRKNIFAAVADNWHFIAQHRILLRAILGATWFWIIGAFVAVQIYPLCSKILNTSEGVITLFLVLFSIGVAVGSYVCNKILKGVIHTAYVPLGALGMAICLSVIYFLSQNYPTPEERIDFLSFWRQEHAYGLSISMFMLAFWGGLYVIPLNALMQSHAPKAYVATVIAGNNIFNALGMALSAIMAALLLALGFDLADLFLIMAVLSLVVTFYICSLLPDALTRSLLQSVLVFLFHTRIRGLSNFRKAGKRVLIVANHVSLLDGVLLAAEMPERITFAVNSEWANKWFMPVVRLLADFYPVDSRNPLSIRKLIDELKKNKKIMIFPEGRITVTGSMMKIYEGAGIIAQKAGAKILPVRISGAQFSKFSYLKNKLPTRWFPDIKLDILAPRRFEIEGFSSRREYRRKVSSELYDIMVDMIYKTSDVKKTLFSSLVEARRVFGSSHIIAEDIKRKPLNYKSFILKSCVLGEIFKKKFAGEKNIGVMLPNVLANAVSFFALQYADKTPAMLNYTLGVTPFAATLKAVGLKAVISSHSFIEQAKLTNLEDTMKNNGVRIVYLEDLAHQISFMNKLQGWKNFFFCYVPKQNPENPAVILFTSGSEGLPKAVVLSHSNLQANRNQIAAVIPFNAEDKIFNALPMFHSFGLGIGTLLPILSGVKVFFYPSPLHYRIVPELCYDSLSTVILGTDTFFSGYGKMADPYDFFALKYAVAGGERLKEGTADLWMKKFGVRILEGYGATETSPVISLNTPMYCRENTVGRILPDIEYKLEELPGIKEGKKLSVRGGNVMLGYMKAELPQVLQPLKDGWYDTGDIVEISDDKYITIKGRAKRFAKIGGEMVSLSAVENVVNEIFSHSINGVLSAEDDKKGERLVLVSNTDEITPSLLRQSLKDKGLSELWIPKEVKFIKNLPLTGSGKLDYVALKEMIKTSL